MPEAERARGAAMAEPLSLPVLARLWQLLLKGVGELGQAPSPRLALEMVLIRTAYAANLPSPADLVKQLQETRPKPAAGVPPPRSGRAAAPISSPEAPKPVGAMPVPAADFRPPPLSPPVEPAPEAHGGTAKPVQTAPMSAGHALHADCAVAGRHDSPARAPASHDVPRQDRPPDDEGPPPDYDEPPPYGSYEGEMERIPVPTSFRELVRLLEQRKIEPLLTARLRTQVRPVSFETGAVTFALEPGADPELPGALHSLLNRLFGVEWSVMRAPSADGSTVAEAVAAEEAAEHEAVLGHPLVQAALDAFPGAQVAEIRHRPIAEPEDWTVTIPPAPDEMIAGDPFDDEFNDEDGEK